MKGIKRYYRTIARQLNYGEEVVQRINKAKSEPEILRIMTSARRGEYDEKTDSDIVDAFDKQAGPYRGKWVNQDYAVRKRVVNHIGAKFDMERNMYYDKNMAIKNGYNIVGDVVNDPNSPFNGMVKFKKVNDAIIDPKGNLIATPKGLFETSPKDIITAAQPGSDGGTMKGGQSKVEHVFSGTVYLSGNGTNVDIRDIINDTSKLRELAFALTNTKESQYYGGKSNNGVIQQNRRLT